MKRKYRWNYSRHLLTLLRGLLIFFCLVSTIEAAQAQTTVRVADGYPKFTGGNRLVAYGEPLTIAYRFTPQGGTPDRRQGTASIAERCRSRESSSDHRRHRNH